jgi:DNA-binding NarL/FixJ family response regulator
VTDAIRVLVVDDHPVFRDGTAALLEREADIEIIGTVGSVADALLAAGREPAPDIVLLDVRLGEDSGLRVVEELGRRSSVVVFTAYDYPQYLQVALRLGAAGFVPKSAPTDELLRAIRRAAAGGLTFDRRALRAEAVALSERERDIVRLLTDGRSNDEIGLALGITTKSVESAIGRIFTRTGAHSRTELAVRAVREGWLDAPGVA